MKRARLPLLALLGPIAALLVLAPMGCDKKADGPAPQAAAATPEPTPAPADDPKPPDKEPAPTPTSAKDPAPAPTPTPSEPAPTPTPTPAEPTPGADPAKPSADGGDKPIAVTATPGTVVRNPEPNSPEWLIQQVLVASMEPDFEKGWALFESLLADDQKIEKALISRKQLNYPASRRKVKLFLYEDPEKPYYKIERIVQEGPNQYRFFLNNNSPDSMPTPCEVRYDEAKKKWGVGICSL